jgi:hypothetical protein
MLQQIRHLEEQLLRPDVRKSASDVEALLAEEFIEFGSSGRMFNRQRMIESLKTEPAWLRYRIQRNLPLTIVHEEYRSVV